MWANSLSLHTIYKMYGYQFQLHIYLFGIFFNVLFDTAILIWIHIKIRFITFIQLLKSFSFYLNVILQILSPLEIRKQSSWTTSTNITLPIMEYWSKAWINFKWTFRFQINFGILSFSSHTCITEIHVSFGHYIVTTF